MKPAALPRRQRGVGLLDAMIAIAILAFGMLGMTKLQGRMVTAATDSQQRTTAVMLADELLSMAMIDDVANRPCYTLPQVGTCPTVAASARATAWATRVAGSLTGSVTSGVTQNTVTNRLTVTIGWTGKSHDDVRQLQVQTDDR